MFTTSISHTQATTTAMISATLPNGTECEQVMGNFDSKTASKQEREEYAYCVQEVDQQEQESAEPIIGMAVAVAVFMLLFMIGAIAAAERLRLGTTSDSSNVRRPLMRGTRGYLKGARASGTVDWDEELRRLRMRAPNLEGTEISGKEVYEYLVAKGALNAESDGPSSEQVLLCKTISSWINAGLPKE